MADFVEILSPKALADLKEANQEVLTLISNMDKVGIKMKGASTPSGANTANKELTAHYVKLEKDIEKVRLAEIRLQQSREKAFDKYEAQLTREQTKLAAAQNLYSKVEVKLRSLSNEYKELATAKAIGAKQTDEEAKRMEFLLGKITKYDTALKAVDATMGKHSRNVGNYTNSGFNPLANSINQLTREMPAFTYSVQTGFMALSNNIPIFTDAIGNAIAQNKLLQAEGKPTTSVLKQLAGAFLSWQTLMGVGITLLTVYGKEIGEFISGLVGANNVMDDLNKNQKEYNKSRTEGRKDAQGEILELRKYLAVLNDKKLSDEQRKIAQDAILKQYPYYIRSVEDAMLVDGKYSQGVNDLILALEKRKEVEKKTELNVINKQKLVDLSQELDLQRKIEKQAKLSLDTAFKRGVSAQGLATLSNDYNKALDKRISTEKELKLVQAQTIKNDADIIALKKETIGLEFQNEKANEAQKERIRNDYAEVESLYNLRIARLEEARLLQKEIQENKDATDYGRLEARKEYSRLSLEILDEQFKKERALSEMQYAEDLQKANEIYLKNKENGFNDVQNAEEYAKAIADITNKYNNEKELSNINYSKAFKENAYSDAEFNDKLLKETFDKEEKYRKKTIEEVEKLNSQINKSNQQRYLKISNDEDKTLKARQLAFQEYQNLALLEIQVEQQRALAKADPSEYDGIIQKYKDLKAGIQGLQTPLEIAQEKTDAFLRNSAFQTISNGLDQLGLSSAKLFLDIDQNGQSTFDKLFEGAENLKEQFAVVFQTVGDVFQDVMNVMAQASQARFDREREQLAQEKEIAIAFAGDSQTAIDEINRQAEEKEKQLRVREFKAKQQQAKANIIIDTAQAIIGLWANPGFPAAIPLAIIVGALGAAQLAVVSSQQPPAYKDGTQNHKGGLMLVNDGNGSNFAETIQTPDGNIYQPKERNVFMNAPKGTKVFTHDQWQKNLDNILMSNDINYSQPNIVVNGGGMSDAQVDRIVSTINNKSEAHLNIDKNGFDVKIRNGHTTKEILNNQVTFGR